MASRMLHYVIALKIANKVPINNMNRFIIGCLIPDLSSHDDGSYSIAHFSNTNKSDGIVKKGIDWSLFEEKYRDKVIEDSLYLGYLCHLISDAIWFKLITDKYVRIYPKKDRITYIKKGYEDFQKLNALLIEKYELQNPDLPMIEIELEEIKNNLFEKLLEDFQKDFVIHDNYEKEDMLIYPYDAVMNFLEQSIKVCIKEIRALMNDGNRIDPEEFYTENR